MAEGPGIERAHSPTLYSVVDVREMKLLFRKLDDWACYDYRDIDLKTRGFLPSIQIGATFSAVVPRAEGVSTEKEGLEGETWIISRTQNTALCIRRKQ